jgi:hypothetical protein
VTSARESFVDFARTVLTTETGTEAGRINLAGLVAVFLLGVGAGVIDLVQALARLGIPDYETGIPGLYSFARLVILTLLLCVVMLIIADALRGDGRGTS